MSGFELDRERVIQSLCAHYASDHLSTQELEVRFDRAYKAQTMAELHALVAALPALPSSVAPPAPLYGVAGPGDTQEPERRHLVLMSELKKRGTWTPARVTRVRCVMGAAVFDLREAHLAPGVTEFDVSCVMGEVKFFVPPGVIVECEGNAIMGAFDDSHSHFGEPGAPRVRIKGMAFMGNVIVKTRLPGESALDAWRRRLLRDPR